MRDTVHNRYNKMKWKYFNEIQKKKNITIIHFKQIFGKILKCIWKTRQ